MYARILYQVVSAFNCPIPTLIRAKSRQLNGTSNRLINYHALTISLRTPANKHFPSKGDPQFRHWSFPLMNRRDSVLAARNLHLAINNGISKWGHPVRALSGTRKYLTLFRKVYCARRISVNWIVNLIINFPKKFSNSIINYMLNLCDELIKIKSNFKLYDELHLSILVLFCCCAISLKCTQSYVGTIRILYPDVFIDQICVSRAMPNWSKLKHGFFVKLHQEKYTFWLSFAVTHTSGYLQFPLLQKSWIFL